MGTEGLKGALPATLVITSLMALALYTAPVAPTDAFSTTWTMQITDNYLVTADDATHLSTVSMHPTDAACVGDANGDWVIPSYDLFVGTSATGENWRTFLKFDISCIPSGATINSATLYAYPYFGPYDDNITVDAKRVDNDDWDESTITWNNAPWDNVGAVLDSDLVTVGEWIGVGEWNDWDVTSFVAGECAGDGVASILLQSENEGLPEYVNYAKNQPDGTSNYPYLEVDYTLSGWTGMATFSLENLYAVNVEKILDLYQGSKLVVKFYTYGDALENENVVETFSPPWHVEENKRARHPDGVGVKKARLDLTTDDTGNVISTIASFTVRKVDLEIRFSRIPGEWFLAPPPERTELEIEFSRIPGAWFLAPSG